MLKTYNSKYLKIKGKGKSNISFTKLKSFQDNAKANLFDISLCKCKQLHDCSCVLSNKVPVEEREFLIDQRTARNMVIGSVDKTLTAKKK